MFFLHLLTVLIVYFRIIIRYGLGGMVTKLGFFFQFYYLKIRLIENFLIEPFEVKVFLYQAS